MGRPLPLNVAAAGPTPPPPRVTIHGLEVVQVIQDLAHSVPLIAQKKTVARAYIASADVGASVQVRGELRVLNAQGVELRVPSLNAATAGPLPAGSVQPLREDISRSLNFLLPAGAVLRGRATLELARLTRDGDGAAVPASPLAVTVDFVEAPPLRVKFFGVRYRTSNTSPWFEPAEKHFRMAESWIKRAYPTHEVIVSRLIINASKNWPLACEDVNLQLAGIRRQDMAAGGDPRTHYFGLVDDRGGGNFMRGCASDVPDHPAPDTVASGPAGTLSFDWDFDGSYADWYSAHELAHTFGRRHPGHCNNNSSDDPNFPFPNGQLSTVDDRFVGFDVGDNELGLPMQALPGQTWTDVMTYCANEWMCSYTFEGILARLRAEQALGAPPPSPLAGIQLMAASPEPEPRVTVGRLGHLLAVIDMDAQGRALSGKIHSFAALEKGVPSREFPESPARVEFLKFDGTVIASRALRVKESTCCEGHDHHRGMIDAVMLIPDQAARLRLRLNGESTDEWNLERSPSSLLRVRALAAAAALEPAAPEDEEARYTVQASRDRGRTWETIAVNVEAGEWQLEPRNYPGLSSVLVRILSSTGATTSSRVTEVPLR